MSSGRGSAAKRNTVMSMLLPTFLINHCALSLFALNHLDLFAMLPLIMNSTSFPRPAPTPAATMARMFFAGSPTIVA